MPMSEIRKYFHAHFVNRIEVFQIFINVTSTPVDYFLIS